MTTTPKEPLVNEIAMLAAEASFEGMHDVESALMLIVRGMRLAPCVQRRLVNVCADVVGFAEWMEGSVAPHSQQKCVR